jgi:hypothetical protein
METTTIPPQNFKYPEVAELYEIGLDLPQDKLDFLVSLPKAEIVADLEMLIRNELENSKLITKDSEASNLAFFHSLMLLGHFQSEESLPLIFEVFSLNDDTIEYYFGDLFIEDLWTLTLKCGLNQVDLLVDFIKKPNPNTMYVQTDVAESLCQIGHHYPERRIEIIKELTNLLHFYNKMPKEAIGENELFLISSLAESASEFNATELLPIIESFYNKKQLNSDLNGDWKTYQKEFGDGKFDPKKELFLDVRDWYKTEGLKLKNDNTKIEIEELRLKLQEARKVFQKLKSEHLDNLKQVHALKTGKKDISRNDPCPCGSGKKFKRCHGLA